MPRAYSRPVPLDPARLVLVGTATLCATAGVRADNLCVQGDPQATIAAYDPSGVPLPPGVGVVPGQALKWRVRMEIDPGGPGELICHAAGGEMAISLPDGSFLETAGYPGTPEITPFGPFEEYQVVPAATYHVDAADTHGGQIVARVDFGQTEYLAGAGIVQLNGLILSDDQPDCAPASDVTSHTLLQPAIGLATTVQSDCASDAGALVIRYHVTNAGDADLADVAVADKVFGAPAYVSGDDGDGLLEAAETWIFERTPSGGGGVSTASVTAHAVTFLGEVVASHLYAAGETIVVPDEPGCTCAADLDGDGLVGLPELLAVVTAWGPCPGPCESDLDGSGVVDEGDLIAVIIAWGDCQP